MTRETVEEKAIRYLTERRLRIVLVSPDVVEAAARGNDNTVYRTRREAGKGSACSCPARGRCCHREALERVT